MKLNSKSRSNAKARRANMSRKKGGMFRNAGHATKKIFTEVFMGKNKVESVDKAKDVITAVLEGVETQTTRAPTMSRRSVSTFLENQNAFSPKIKHDSLNHALNEPEHSYRTPNKCPGNKHHPKIPKSSRHRRIAPPESYAPTLRNEVPNVNRELFRTS